MCYVSSGRVTMGFQSFTYVRNTNRISPDPDHRKKQQKWASKPKKNHWKLWMPGVNPDDFKFRRSQGGGGVSDTRLFCSAILKNWIFWWERTGIWNMEYVSHCKKIMVRKNAWHFWGRNLTFGQEKSWWEQKWWLVGGWTNPFEKLVKLDHVFQVGMKIKKALVYHHLDENPAPETPRWSQEQAPAPDDSSCLTVAGKTNPPKRWQFQNWWTDIVNKYLGDVWKLYTFLFVFFGPTFIESIYRLLLFVNTIMRAILSLNRISGGIPNCEVASHAASHGTRNPRHGTFETYLQHMSWNLPDKTLKPFQTFRNKLSKAFQKQGQNPHFKSAMKKLQKHLWNLCTQNLPNSGTFQTLFTTTWPSHLPNMHRNLRCLKTENLNHQLPTIPIGAASRPGRWPQSSRRHKGVHQTSSWSA